jgi:putative redox protein
MNERLDWLLYMKSKVFFKNEQNLRLCGVLHIPASWNKFGIIICHGFAGDKNKNFIPELASALEEKDFLTLRFDFSGNGESEGLFEDRTWTGYVEDLRCAIDFVKSHSVERVCVVGHSMGAAIAVIAYSAYRNFDCAILLAPPFGLKKGVFTEEDFRGMEDKGYLDFVDHWGNKRRLRKEYFEVRRSYDLLEEAKDLAVPTFIVIGAKDEVVSVEQCIKAYEIIKAAKKLEVMENEGHAFHNRADKLLKAIVEFLHSLR